MPLPKHSNNTSQHFPIQNINYSFIDSFKAILRKYQYTHNGLLQRGINPFAYTRFDLPIFANLHPVSSEFGILLHLFFLGRRVRTNMVRKIFNNSAINTLRKMSIFEDDDHSYIRSSVLFLPYKEYYFACDFIMQAEDRINDNHGKYDLVYPVSLDSITLSEVSITKPVDAVLDIGCGSGFLSIIASRFGKQVTGIDINPRAVNFSQFNAVLNSVSNCKFICGDLYNSIKEKKFGLILSNPPYEITLKKTNLFQDGGRDGSRILKRIIQESPDHLTKSGFCQIITKMGEFEKETNEQIFVKWLQDEKIHIYFLLIYKMGIDQSAYFIGTDFAAYGDESIQYIKFSKNISKILLHFKKIRLSHRSFGVITFTKADQYKYVEQEFNSSRILAAELSEKLRNNIYKHFARNLGVFGIYYFLKCVFLRILTNLKLKANFS